MPTREAREEVELWTYQSLKHTLLPSIAFSLVAWLVQWRFAPDLIVNSRGDVTTLLTALPAASLALLAVMIAGLLVAIQVAAETTRSIGVWIMVRDQRTWGWVYFLSGIALATLLLGAFAPDEGEPSAALASALATLTIVFALMFLFSGRVLRARLAQYTDPYYISQFAAAPGHRALARGDGEMFEAQLEEVGQVLLYAARARDPKAHYCALNAFRGLVEAFLRADDLRADKQGVGLRSAEALARASDELIAIDPLPSIVLEAPSATYELAVAAKDNGQDEVAIELVRGLGRMATSSWSRAIAGAFVQRVPRTLTTPLECLADLANTGHKDDPAATAALECWVIGVVYMHEEARDRTGARDRRIAEQIIADSAEVLGSIPNWRAALDLIETHSFLWSRVWRGNASELLETLAERADAAPEHSTRDLVEAAVAKTLEGDPGLPAES